MNLGAFSVSLSVKDIKASKEFYEKLSFEVMMGKIEDNWIVLRNGEHTIGLFQGMFENNILTFNPGWNSKNENLDEFEDIRQIQKKLKADGIELIQEADETTTGPASLMISDPDGNTILLDQHR